MLFSSWLRNWKRSSTTKCRTARKRAAFRPMLEALEARDVPSFGSPISTSVPAGAQVTAQVAADVNGDGKADLIVATNEGIFMALGKANGHFTSFRQYLLAGLPNGSSQTALAVADVNGDGKLDIITASDGGSGGSNVPLTSMSLLPGNGDGTFQAAQGPYWLGMFSTPTSLAVADFNADGRTDFAVSGSGQVTVMFINGTAFSGSTYAVPAIAGGISSTVAARDLNCDGKADLVVADGAGAAFVLLNNGNGSFAAPVAYSAGGDAYSVAVGDVNGDGSLDLMTANAASNSISVLLGNGDGTFGTVRTYAVGGSPSTIAVGDFNKDGTLDIAMAGSEMDVLLNNGDGTFGTAQRVGPAGSDLTVADINGDGFPDLAQIDANGISIDVLLNKADWGGTSGHKGHK
jgi:hypothetical protein